MNANVLGPLASSGLELPLYGWRVPAGFPSPCDDHLESSLSLDALMEIRAPHTYLVRASGDSMTGVGIFDRDVLVVDRSREAQAGEIVIAALNSEPLVKIFDREGEQLVLRSANPKYPPCFILEGDELSVWGVVRFSIRAHSGA